MRITRLTLVHAAIAALAAVEFVRALHRASIREVIVDEPARFAFLVALPIASAIASLASLWIGARAGNVRGAFQSDLIGIFAFFVALAFFAKDPQTREVVGLLYVGVLVARLAPLGWAIATGRIRSVVLTFIVSLLFYAPLAIWSGAATLAQGDQPHYLLAADAIARGTGDVAAEYATPGAFTALAGTPLSPADVETHLVSTSGGTHLVQGFGLAALLAPGWALGGKNGALLVLALVGAIASVQTLLLCRETVGSTRAAGAAWLVSVGLAPFATAATTIYPNIVGAAAIVIAFRYLFTAPVRRPVVAGVAAALTLLLTPRDAAAILFLLPFAFAAGRSLGLRFAGTLAVCVVAVSALDLVSYGLPVPYAGYVFGIDAAQRLDGESTLRLRPDIGLSGIFFDRAFGFAGSAPWLFIGLLGLGAAIRGAARRSLLPAAAAVGGSVLALAFYRLWEGGYAPPNRYIVDVLPLWAPFVGTAFVRYPGRVRQVFALIVVLSAIGSFFLLAIPNLAFNSFDSARLVETFDHVLVVDPFRLLPSFEDPKALGPAFIRVIPFAIGAAILAAIGLRARRA